jgi:UDP-N-acetylmuramate dehydrogenase
LAKSFEVPMTIIGEGSNVLVSDSGVRGLVIKNIKGKITLREKGFLGFRRRRVIPVELDPIIARDKISNIEDVEVDYEENDFPGVEVSVGSGVGLQAGMNKLFEMGITGLERFAWIPGTVGGAVYKNVQSDGRFIGEIVKEVMVLDSHGGVVKVPVEEMAFEGYRSRLHDTDEVVLEVVLKLKKGDLNKARAITDYWQKKRSRQPLNSAGGVFKNISEEDRRVLGYPTPAPEYVVEHILNMTGYKVGGAMISPNHHNFIVNKGGATAKDYLAVRNEIVRRAKEAIGLKLEDEIIRLGEFDD